MATNELGGGDGAEKLGVHKGVEDRGHGFRNEAVGCAP